jgi:D-erythrulose 1-phosphate 3-epimerase
MRLRLGVNTCFAVKRWPRPADWAPIVRDRLGLGLVQHSLDLVNLDAGPAGIDGQAEAIRTAAGAHGLDVQSTFTGLAAYSSNMLLDPEPAQRAECADWFERAIAFSATIKAAAAGGHVGAYSVPDWRSADRRAGLWRELKVWLERLARDARRAGLEYLVVENLAAAREPSTMAMIGDLLTDGDAGHVPIRLCLDVGHMCVPGTTGADRDPYAWLRALGGNAPMVQLQQSDERGDHHWPFTPERNAVGRIDADRVIDALGESGADDSLLLLEVIPPFEADDDTVLDELEASVEYWREAIARQGAEAA